MATAEWSGFTRHAVDRSVLLQSGICLLQAIQALQASATVCSLKAELRSACTGELGHGCVQDLGEAGGGLKWA